jgi:hypothetical protein
MAGRWIIGANQVQQVNQRWRSRFRHAGPSFAPRQTRNLGEILRHVSSVFP